MKNWALADSIRDQLKEQGIVLEDTPGYDGRVVEPKLIFTDY